MLRVSVFVGLVVPVVVLFLLLIVWICGIWTFNVSLRIGCNGHVSVLYLLPFLFDLPFGGLFYMEYVWWGVLRCRFGG